MRERHPPRKGASLAGQLLLAHPALREPTFRHTVILLSAHSAEGAMGVVLNRPLGQQLAELNAGFALGPLAGVPLYAGGPVSPDQLLLVSWQWLPGEGAFQLQFGINPDQAADLIGTPGLTVRGFLGYAGWSAGQLEGEMKRATWLVSPVDGIPLEDLDGGAIWRTIVGGLDPELKFLADEPDDPSLN